MKRIHFAVAAVAVGLTVFSTGCQKQFEQNQENTENTVEAFSRNSKPVGYLYTTTNGEGMNQVVKFSRYPDGMLSQETAYGTNSAGGANVNAGGDAHGDFDSQGAVQIIGNYLLNVNAGGNNISVFSLDKTNGNLVFKNNTSAGGTRPVSITFTKKSGTTDAYWVVVGNQWNNPNVQKDGTAIERYPNDAFHAQDLTQPDASDQERNIRLFSFNAANGTLTSERLLDTYVRENGGPTTVSFSDDGTRLAVSTWGIAHFNTMSPSLEEQHASRVYIYNFSNGNISGKRFFEEEGIAGTIGISWAKDNNTRLYASNFNLTTSKNMNSLTVLDDLGSSVTKTGHLAVTSPSGINEACWTILNPAGDKLYVASFATNLVSSFDISATSTKLIGVEKRGGLAPAGDSKDMYVTPDNQYLYNLGAFQSFSINRFKITGNSVNYRSQTILNTTASGAGIVGKFNFLGLNGFDL
ncbi:MAG: hypothetical protein ABIP79_00485 [Chitinophagaceae bacterium]